MSNYTPIENPVTGLEHTVLPLVKHVPIPKALLWVGNSFFFFNNGSHRFLRRLLAKAPTPPAFRSNMVAINGASLSWHDVESYFRPNAISSYTITNDGTNTVVFRDPKGQLWDTLIMMDSSQGPIHPVLGEHFVEFAKKDAAICRSHNATPVFLITWAYYDKPEMTAQLADAITKVANDNNALVIPAGLAFALAKKKMPDCPLHIGDKRHPTPAGSYLLACTVAEALFGIDVRTIDFACDIDENLAAYLRQIAHETVTRFYGR